ncbi:MAG: lipopolysaccharide biosynthesis protein [Propionibacteriaceae bacterium]|nr:lipopolysaccharide biosynthesis protein [Propionibacteriaceae bacterium]
MIPRVSIVGRLLGRGSIYTLASAAPILAGILVTPFLTRSMGVAEYGVVAAAIVVMQFAVGVLAMGLPVAITRHALTEHSGHAGARGVAVLGAILAFGTALVIAGACAFFGVSGWLSESVLAAAIATGGLGAGLAMVQALAVAREDVWEFVALAFGTSLIAPAVGLGVVVVWRQDPLAYVLALLCTYACISVVAYSRVLRKGRIGLPLADLRQSLRVGLPLVPHQLAINSVAGGSVLVGGWLLGATGSAGAQVSLYVGAVPAIIASAVSYAWMPIILKVPEAERGVQLEVTTRVVSWLAALGSTALGAIAPWVLAVLVPRSYDLSAMVPLSATVSMSAVFAAAFQGYSILVVASGRTRAFAIATPLALGLGLVASAVAVRIVGLMGLGVGYVLTYVLLAGVTRALARHVSRVRLRDASLLLPVAWALVGTCAAVALPWDSAWAIACRVVIAACVLGAAGYVFVKGLRGPKADELVGAGENPSFNP